MQATTRKPVTQETRNLLSAILKTRLSTKRQNYYYGVVSNMEKRNRAQRKVSFDKMQKAYLSIELTEAFYSNLEISKLLCVSSEVTKRHFTFNPKIVNDKGKMVISAQQVHDYLNQLNPYVP
jgi:hypothetical protein